MNTTLLLLFICVSLAAFFILGRARSLSLVSNDPHRRLNSLPYYYGILTLIWAGLPVFFIFGMWILFDDQIIRAIVVNELPPEISGGDDLSLILNKIYNLAYGSHPDAAPDFILAAANRILQLEKTSQWLATFIIIISLLIGGSVSWLRIHPDLKARNQVERVFRYLLMSCAFIAIFTTIGIILSVIVESFRFFNAVPLTEFLFGTEWNPQNALRTDQVTGESSFGAIPLFVGTLYIAGIALLVAVPTGLMSAIYLSEYASSRFRGIFKPLLEILAGVPTVVYGFFAAITMAPLIRDIAIWLGLNTFMTVTSESILAVGLVMGVMIIPFVSSLSDDVINAVPQSLRDGALALGSTQSEMVKIVVIPAALPGIVGGVLLAASRAIGETMIVVMAAGLAAKLTANPLDSMTTVTVQIVTLLVGDQEFDSPKTLAAFALGLMLFIVTLCLNYLALHVVKTYREQYE